MLKYNTCAHARPGLRPFVPLDCKDHDPVFPVSPCCTRSVQYKVAEPRSYISALPDRDRCESCPLFTDPDTLVHIQADTFRADIYLDRLCDLTITNTRKLFKLMHRWDFDNRQAIDRLTAYLEQAIQESEDAWKLASREFTDGWRKVSTPKSRHPAVVETLKNKHFTWDQRLTLERMLKKGFTKAAIASALGKCERSIYYEINRGLCVQQTSEYEFIEVYCPEVAERKYRDFLKDKGRDLKIGKDHALARRLEELVMVQGFAPGAALAEIRNNGEVYDTVICENTLYNYIYRGDVFLHLTPEHLHNKGRRHYAAKSKRQAARSSNGKSIENRPQEVKGRGSFGHWEMDSIMGCKGSKKALLVLTERRTRMGIVMLLEDHTAASVVKAINRLERRFGKLFYKLFKSITVDNGCEFQDFEGIEAAHRRKGKRTVVFFCHPYSAFERGSNENMNRLIRRFFPKGTSFDTVTPEEVSAAEKWVNSYPRKLLGWQSAATLFEKELLSA